MDDEANARRRLLQQLAAAAAGGFAAQALAASKESRDEALPPLLQSSPELAAGVAGEYPMRRGEVGVVDKRFAYGHGLRYGIRTDGSDTTAEVKNWRDSIVGMGGYADPYGLLHASCKGVLPAGHIRVTEPGALLDMQYKRGPELWGFVIEGEGPGITTVFHDPKTPGPLMFAANRVLGLVVRDIHFATPDEPKERCDWLVSQSAGMQQYFTFQNLAFDGGWKAGLRLSGVTGMDPMLATNSECKFDRISVSSRGFSDGLVCDSNEEGMQSGQFVNYWLSNIASVMWAGTLVRLRRGGHINITNLDVSGYKPRAESWVIDLPEVTGNDGAHSLLIRNARFEPLSPFARFLRCRWERGNVCIDGYDDTINRRPDRLSFDIRASNSVNDWSLGKFAAGTSGAGAQYWFVNGRFTGVHRYTCSGKAGDVDGPPAAIQYQNCEFCGLPNDPAARNIHSFVQIVADGDKSPVLRPHLRFRACRVEAVANHVTDWDLGVQGAHVSTTAPIKSLRFGTSDNGRLPSNAATSMVLPPGALVLRVSWIIPAARAPNRPYRFELSNGYDSDRRQLLSVLEGDDFSARAGRVDLIAYETVPAPLPDGFDPMRAATLVLRETRGPGVHPSAECIVEYI